MSHDDPDYHRRCNNCKLHIDDCTCEGHEIDMRDVFEVTYYKELWRAVRDHPEEYGQPANQTEDQLRLYVMGTYTKMLAALEKGTFNKDGRAFRATCRALKINHTYKAIREYAGYTW